MEIPIGWLEIHRIMMVHDGWRTYPIWTRLLMEWWNIKGMHAWSDWAQCRLCSPVVIFDMHGPQTGSCLFLKLVQWKGHNGFLRSSQETFKAFGEKYTYPNRLEEIIIIIIGVCIFYISPDPSGGPKGARIERGSY